MSVKSIKSEGIMNRILILVIILAVSTVTISAANGNFYLFSVSEGEVILDLAAPPETDEVDWVWENYIEDGFGLVYNGGTPIRIHGDGHYPVIVKTATRIVIEDGTVIQVADYDGEMGDALTVPDKAVITGEGFGISLYGSSNGIRGDGDLTINGVLGTIGSGRDGIYAMDSLVISGNINALSASRNGVTANGDIVISGIVGNITIGGENGLYTSGNIIINGTVGNIMGNVNSYSGNINVSGTVSGISGNIIANDDPYDWGWGAGGQSITITGRVT